MNKTIGLDAILLEHYVSRDSFRTAITQLHFDEGNVVATNAYHLIIVPQKYIDDLPSSVERYPSYKKVIPEHFIDAPLFKFDTTALRDAFSIFERKKVYKDCEECKGRGEYTCSCCDSDVECRYCDGTGHGDELSHYMYSDEDAHCKIGNGTFSMNWVRALFEVAAALGSEDVYCVVSESSKGNVFYVNDVMVLIMPIYTTDKTKYSDAPGDGEFPVLIEIPLYHFGK